MTELVLLSLENWETVRCTDLDDARQKADSEYYLKGKILVEITPKGGGPMTTLEFDRPSHDWVAVT